MGIDILVAILAFWAVASLARIAKSLDRIASVNEAFAVSTLGTATQGSDESPATAE